MLGQNLTFVPMSGPYTTLKRKLLRITCKLDSTISVNEFLFTKCKSQSLNKVNTLPSIFYSNVYISNKFSLNRNILEYAFLPVREYRY